MKNVRIKSDIDFSEGFERFKKFKTVKVDKILKESFLEYISSKMVQNNIFLWCSTVDNLKTCSKFKRTA